MDPLRGRVSAWKKLLHQWQARRDIPFRKKYFVGYDLEGNSYWEFYLDNNAQRLRRKVEHRVKQANKVDYFESIPPPWLQWLRYTRQHHPTVQELLAEQQRQYNIKLLAKQADERWHAEKLRLENEHQASLRKELNKAQDTKPENGEDAAQTEYKTVHKTVRDGNEENPFDKARKSDTPIETASIKPRR